MELLRADDRPCSKVATVTVTNSVGVGVDSLLTEHERTLFWIELLATVSKVFVRGHVVKRGDSPT